MSTTQCASRSSCSKHSRFQLVQGQMHQEPPRYVTQQLLRYYFGGEPASRAESYRFATCEDVRRRQTCMIGCV
jgi:hypothetical protein